MPKGTGAARDTQAKGRTKKLWKASAGKPNFIARAKHTLGRCTAAPIFAWIIIQNRGQDSYGFGKLSVWESKRDIIIRKLFCDG